MKSQTKSRAVIELLIAGSIWGFGFVAAVWSLHIFPPAYQTSVRFFVAALVVLPFVTKTRLLRENFRLACLPGLFLCACLILQTAALKYTTATNCGFITVLYVVFVPILELLFLKKKIAKIHWALVAVALIGTALICKIQMGVLNRGDFYTLLCSLAASGQIIAFAAIAHRVSRPLIFNMAQSVWVAVPALLFAIWSEPFPHFTWSNNAALAWVGLGWLIFGSTLTGFYFQVRAQKVLSPSTASILFLTESPFAALFAALLLHESLSVTQWFGSALIMTSVIIAAFLGKPESVAADHAMAHT